MADLTPLSPQHTQVNSPEPDKFRTSARAAGFPLSPLNAIYPSGHTGVSQISGPVLPVGRVNQYQALAARQTTYSFPTHTVNQKIQGPGAGGGTQGHSTVV